MRWFGEPWPATGPRAPVCEDDDYNVTTPVGRVCLFCGVAIDLRDQGLMMPNVTLDTSGGPILLTEPVHLGCLLRMIGVVDEAGWPR